MSRNHRMLRLAAVLGAAAIALPALASGPVKKTATGCVKGGVFTTDDGYAYKVRASGGGDYNLRPFEGRKVRMTGNLLPGDVFFPARAPQSIAPCKR